jgi:hypothetical protein
LEIRMKEPSTRLALAVGVSLAVCTVLMFASLHHAATHLQASM